MTLSSKIFIYRSSDLGYMHHRDPIEAYQIVEEIVGNKGGLTKAERKKVANHTGFSVKKIKEFEVNSMRTHGLLCSTAKRIVHGVKKRLPPTTKTTIDVTYTSKTCKNEKSPDYRDVADYVGTKILKNISPTATDS